MDFLRRLFTERQPENRGTVTIFSDNEYILGVPHGTTAEQAYHAAQGLRNWIEDPTRKSLVLPFPVEVIDKRSDTSLWKYSGVHQLDRPLERIAQVLERIDRKTVKRRPRIIMCQHPELHPGEQIG